MEAKNLRGLVEGVVGAQWKQWAKQHPQLAAAVDRVRLVETVVTEARKDPEVRGALLEAERNNEVVAAVGGVVELVEKVVRKVLG